MLDIVRVVPADAYFSLTWMIGTRCNYDCMYCPTELHDDSSTPASLEKLQQYWKSIYEKTQHQKLKYKISFTGGEVTVNKNFKNLVQWIRENYAQDIFQILLTTNGSASTAYYRNLYQYVDNISFSLHSEHADEQAFFKTVCELKSTIPPNKFLHVCIMDEYWNQSRIAQYVELLEQRNISYGVNKINYDKANRNVVVFKGVQNFAPSEL